ncbi:MAG: SGNH/GDSL hydrolase family protein [Candidatus Bathyarchaeia archaeon]
MPVKVILCYGDSNTWGYEPGTGNRYPRDKTWPGVLRRNLGEGYIVIDEGLNGRTTVWDDPTQLFPEKRNGLKYLIPCLESHMPIDLVIFMLGTNDLKKRFSLSPVEVAKGMKALVEAVRVSGAGPGGGSPRILIVAPPRIGQLFEFAEEMEGAEEKSGKLPRCYRLVAEEMGCEFLDASEVASPSKIDGVHLDLEGHQRLGEALTAHVKRILE